MQLKTYIKEEHYNRLCAEEDARLSKSDKYLGIKTQITETAILAKNTKYSIESADEKKIFLPSLGFKFYRSAGVIIISLFLIGGLHEMYLNTPSDKGKIILCSFFLAFLGVSL